MILSIDIKSKAFGPEVLYKNLDFNIGSGQKVGLIGRNGCGKSTLFGIMTGQDKDYDGEVTSKKGLMITSLRQEHHGFEQLTVLEYILQDLPNYQNLKQDIDALPDTMGSDQQLIQRYSDALEKFGEYGYYDIENDILALADKYQLAADRIGAKLAELSGGQKKLVELIKIQRSRADLALIDEPTNHMDYIAKQAFIDWLSSSKEAVLVISHDRDVLNQVDKIIEIRDQKALIYRGNYQDYLRSNTSKVSSEISEYEVTQKRVANLRDDIVRFKRLKEKSRSGNTIKRFKSLEQRARADLAEYEGLQKPTFWIDQDSSKQLKRGISESYAKHKAQNIKVNTGKIDSNQRQLIDISKLSLGYDAPLFDSLDLRLYEGQKMRIHGRNGCGKTTIIKQIVGAQNNTATEATVFDGQIDVADHTKIGLYHQELSKNQLKLSLGTAIENAYEQKDLAIDQEGVRRIMASYLFNPMADFDKPTSLLSGGQKARLQIIAMLAGKPNLLILDEPTNHLDLPSIEELERALLSYQGAILFVSHDSFFVGKLGADEVLL